MENHMFNPDQILWFCLRNTRPDGSPKIAELIGHLSALAVNSGPCSIYQDAARNLWIDTRGQGLGRTLFMAHMDTVTVPESTHEIWLDDGGNIHTAGAAILGADDGAGVGILAALIAAQVPALYLFTQGEETGGKPAAHAARHERARVENIDRAISFDRKGTHEICGEQMAGTLASRDFVAALSDGLGLGHVWGSGTYTDNSEFQDIIPEIVNISVGYQSNHSKAETLYLPYFEDLRAACLSMDWESLPTIGPDTSGDFVGYGGSGWAGSSWPQDWRDIPAIDLDQDRRKPARKKRAKPGPVSSFEIDDQIRESLWSICDSLLIEPGSYHADQIRSELERFSDAILSGVRS